MLRPLLDTLNTPFPESQSGKSYFIEILYIGIFVAAFLYLFNPFGLQNMPLGIGLSSVVFGLITIAGSLTYKYGLKLLIKIRTDIPSWTLWKWIVMTTGMVVWVAMGNFAYLLASLPDNFVISDFPKMLQYTVMVGITPVVVSGMLIQMRAAKMNVDEASAITADDRYPTKQAMQSQEVSFDVGSGNPLSLSSSCICTIEAMQNYLMIYHWDSSINALQKDMVRSTMASAAEIVASTPLIRCHRSFIVNLQRVKEVSGNAQGLKLVVEGLGEKHIPVSRSYITSFKAAFLGEG